eukprot:COSAG01_NODE_14_length_41020_cov_40.702133_11_plen_221_part_00
MNMLFSNLIAFFFHFVLSFFYSLFIFLINLYSYFFIFKIFILELLNPLISLVFFSLHRSGRHTSGDTPIYIAKFIFSCCPNYGITHFIDLGSSNAKFLFAFSHHSQFKCMGIEALSYPFLQSVFYKRLFSFTKVELINDDFHHVKIPNPSIIYLSWTCFNDSEKQKAVSYLMQLLRFSWVITTSSSLCHFIGSSDFKLICTRYVFFPWGLTQLYFHKKLR